MCNIKLIILLILLILLLSFHINYSKKEEAFINKKPLKFIHITKNAGTYIEDTAKTNNILFGRFHKEYGNIKDGPSPWHHIFTIVNKDVKNKYDWFMVVRNPYDRILSEYYCQWGGIGKKNINHSKKDMNNFLIDKINKRSKIGDHYTEQYKYLDNNYKIHIIKFEDLNRGLKELFKIYNLNIKVIDKKINTSKEKNNKLKFTINDFNNELIKLINNVYSKDFELFNYKKLQ
tara:strand:- start:2868 stop:3563 length:696 start_codon:yes stop_codon:yes gene_type:complete